MKVPANCPGPLDKEQKKKIKAERQAATSASPAPAANAAAQGSSDSVNDLPRLNRTDTMGSMNTLSSGYAASANRSLSGTNVRPPTNSNDSASDLGRSNTARRRILAPPPDHYAGSNGDSSDGQPRGKMLYPYQASGDGEVTVDEGAEVTVIEPDGKPSYLFTSEFEDADDDYRWCWLDEGPHTLWRRPRSRLLCRDDALVACPIAAYSSRVYHQFSHIDRFLYTINQEGGPGCGSQTWCQEAEICRGTVHVRS
jgi:hypothetical protein